MRYKVSAVGRARGYAYIDADTLEAAEEQVRKLDETHFEWDAVSDNLSVEKVEQEGGEEATASAPEPQEANHESEPAPVEEPVEEEHGDEHDEEDHPAKKGKKKHKR